MICLTGDIHHGSLNTNEQKYIEITDDSEVKISCRYLKLLEKYGIKATFYVTGKTLDEEWEDFKPIADSELVEIGGHTYGGLPISNLYRAWCKITGKAPVSHSYTHGSCLQQKKDIQKMIDVVKTKAGKNIVSWRSHGLVFDENTYPLLAEMGVQMISDDPSWNKIYAEKTKEGLISHPMNVIMDHDHIYHAHRTKEYVDNMKENWPWPDDSTADSYTIEEWGRMVEKQVLDIEKKGGIATVLMHPICMYTSDNFKTAEKLFKIFSKYKTIWAREIPEYLK
ncbi:MAG: polysaccharide deacetylase family protein [bacterium]|nr:polysaccharide deacetylase family protein [bacterium]